jgi:hypothetical protein
LVEFCEVTDEDVINWWNALDNASHPLSGNNKTPWVRDNTVFLFGHYSDHGSDNLKKGTHGTVRGTANIQGPETRVVFPIMNSRNEKRNEGKPPRIDGIQDASAEVKGQSVPNNAIHHLTKSDQNFVYKGQWVCVKGLSNGDTITFSGKGDEQHGSAAEWKVV